MVLQAFNQKSTEELCHLEKPLQEIQYLKELFLSQQLLHTVVTSTFGVFPLIVNSEMQEGQQVVIIKQNFVSGLLKGHVHIWKRE